jgi:hypothetical protein
MRVSGGRVMVLMLGTGWLASACECADRRYHDAASTSSTTDPADLPSETSTGSAEATSSATTTDDPVDVSRFIGVFHNEHWLVPLGRTVDFPGGVSLANLEIRTDGTASMTMETCSELDGTRHFEWRWEARPGPRLEFLPSPGEDEVLRFMAFAELESLFAYPVDPCGFPFEADGVPITTDTFRPGRACWVNRCEAPSWMVEIDYCEGEELPPCE